MVLISWIECKRLVRLICILTTFLIHSGTPAPHKLLCGFKRVPYDTTTHKCMNGQVVKIPLYVCGPTRVPYNPLSHECVDNMVVTKPSSTESPLYPPQTGKENVVIVTSSIGDGCAGNGASNNDHAIYMILLLLVLQIVFGR